MSVEPVVGWEDGSPHLVTGAGVHPLLATANREGRLRAADVHVATSLGRLAGEERGEVLLALASVVAAARDGSSCVAVEDPRVLDALATSPLVCVAGQDLPPGPPGAGRPVWLADDLVYLDRFWRDENTVAAQVLARSRVDPTVDVAALRDSLGGGRFPAAPGDRQRVATALAVLRGFTVIAGGPGTGKTTTVARILAALLEQPGPTPRIALAAPTGKAAARLQASIAEQTAGLGLDLTARAGTIHRLLGYRPGSRPHHGRRNPLPHDVVIIDETSMVSLPLLARVLDAVRPDARLILIGDPDQLASVDVGAVLADLVERPATPELDPRLDLVVGADLADPATGAALRADAARGVVRLTRGYRNNEPIAALARAVQDGDASAALAVLRDPATPGVELIEIDETTDLDDPVLSAVRQVVVGQGTRSTAAAAAGDAAAALAELGTHQILVAHRSGPHGAGRWSALVRRAVAASLPGSEGHVGGDTDWYVGRPVIVTRNDDDTGLANGDVGVTVRRQVDGRDELAVALDVGGIRLLHPGRLPEHLPLQAITVHRAQGSQYDTVTVVLPDAESPLLTRELLYTAITRARERVVVLGSAASVTAAVQRPAQRASGLRRAAAWDRLHGG